MDAMPPAFEPLCPAHSSFDENRSTFTETGQRPRRATELRRLGAEPLRTPAEDADVEPRIAPGLR